MAIKSPSEPEEKISVQVDEPYATYVNASDLIRAIQAVLREEGEPDAEVTLVITGDEEVHRLNLEFLGEDHATDVLSFPASGPLPDGDAPAPTFVAPPEAGPYLGDIIIAYPYVRRQAEALDRALADELRLLAVHGALHLLGYDHADPTEEATMWARQDAILAELAA